MKYLFSLGLVVCLCFAANAQYSPAPSGGGGGYRSGGDVDRYHKEFSDMISLGITIPNSVNNISDQVYNQQTPLFTLRYEYGINESMGVGGQLGYFQTTTKDDYATDVSYRYAGYQVLGQFYYHLTELPSFDSYTAASVGYRWDKVYNEGDVTIQSIEDNVRDPEVLYFATAGIRYYINPTIGFYGEVHYGQGNNITLNGGATLRL